MEKKLKNTKNQREKMMGFVYVFLLFSVTTTLCCLFLFNNSNKQTMTRKEFAIAKMSRVHEFQDIQGKRVSLVDSIYTKVADFDPGINATYKENDIKFYLNTVKSIYEDNVYDERYKVFFQLSNFYNMWFADKKELWSKKQNIKRFRKNLEECEIGLERRMNQLNER